MSIEREFALVLAAQVSAGLTKGDNELERARASLQTIGLMVLNASDHDEQVAAQLELSYHTTAIVLDGSTHITYRPPGGDNGEEV